MNEDEPFFICSDCAKDIYLKNYILTNSNIQAICTICLKDKLCVDITNDNKITEFCRFLIRYHFPEYVYNSHWGGDVIEKILFDENPIITHNFAERPERDIIQEQFIMDLFDIWNDKSKIELYYGHDESGRGFFPRAIKDEKSIVWEKYKKDIQSTNFFLLEAKAKETISKILTDLKFTLNKNNCYFRARIGFNEIEKKIEINTVKIKVPFKDDEISAPPIFKAKAGRANRHGLSFLYLSSDSETSFSEVRPHPGHYVSIGEFICINDLLLADLRFIDLIKYYESEDNLQIFQLLQDLANELSTPILPEEQEKYLVTQFISDIIRQLDFDGILFNSSVSNGHNLVIFNPNNFIFKKDSSKLIKIAEIEFKYKNVEYSIDNFFERAIEK